MSVQAVVYLAGMLLLWFGERIVGTTSTLHIVLSGVGLCGVVASLVWLSRGLSDEGADRKVALRRQVACGSMGLLAVGLYFCGTDAVLEMVFSSEEIKHQAWVVVTAAWSIMWLAATLPFVALDVALTKNPIHIHSGRAMDVSMGWLSLALALAMLFPLNYLASDLNQRWDLGYFRTADPGTATIGLASALEEPVDAYLFFPTSSDVTQEVRAYFDQLTGENFSVSYVDHALAPSLSEDLRVQDNGYIVFVRGEGDDKQVERIKIGAEFDMARRKLKILDTEVFKALMKVARGPRIAYVTVGHEEMYWNNELSVDRRVNELKTVLRQFNVQVKELGLTNGLATEVPEDASLVFVLSPEESFLDEEVDALNAYRERGGALWVTLDPRGPMLSGLLDPLGLSYDPESTLAIESNYIPFTNGIIDRVNLATNKFTTHASVTTLSRNSRSMFVITPAAVALTVDEDSPADVTMRSLDGTWADFDRDLRFDGTVTTTQGADAAQLEAQGQWPLAVAATGSGDSQWRVIVTADGTWLSDLLLLQNRGNAQLLLDGVAWLTDDESTAGTLNDETDVKIQHTKEGQSWIFYGTVFLFPLIFLVSGLTRIRLRRKG